MCRVNHRIGGVTVAELVNDGVAQRVSRTTAGRQPGEERRPLRFARPALFGSGVLLVAFGALIWTGNGNSLRLIHDVLGVVFVVALWRVAAVAARFGVPHVPVAVGGVWGLAVLTLGLLQKELLVGDWHWTIQVLHLVIGMGAMFWAGQLMSLMRRSELVGISDERNAA